MALQASSLKLRLIMQHPGGRTRIFVFVCLFRFLLPLEAIEAYKLHKLREWTKSVRGKGESIWNGMKIKLFGETTQRNHLLGYRTTKLAE